LKGFQQLLLPIYNYIYTSGLLKRPNLKTKFTSHKELVELLATGDADQFRTGMRNHLENHFSRILEEKR